MTKARPKSSAPGEQQQTSTVEALTRVLDTAPVGMVVATTKGELIYSNRAIEDLLAIEKVTEQPRKLIDLVPLEEQVGLRLQFDRLARGEVTTYRGEHRFCHADGHPIWVMLAASRFPGVTSGADYITVQLTSIELQKRAEEALAYSESRWNNALESARQGVWDHDLRRNTMFYSRMWRIMRGISPEEQVDGDRASWLARVHPDDRDRLVMEADRQHQGDKNFEALEYREQTRNGGYIWILSRGGPIEWDEHGNPTRTVGTDTDITLLKTVEQDLAAEKERLRLTLQSVADGMISANSRGYIEFMNPAAEQLTGFTIGQARGMAVNQVFRIHSERTGQVIDCPVWSCFENDQPVRVDDDAILTNRDGSVRDVRCTAAPVRTDGGSRAGAVLVFQDVSQSRMMQRQLAYSASHDALSGLTNRASFEQSLERVIAACRHQDRTACLVYIDLDHFKPVNDTAGHAAGDALLRQVASTLRDTCRSHDVVARIGGDEFVLLLEGTSLADGMRVAEKAARGIAALLFSWAGREYRVGASAGVTTIGRDPASPLGFMGEADAACYAAKAEGRGRVVAFSSMLTRNKR
ncbi:diguanylate cyclase [Devosia rhizoryzae]|uniref:Diguanylate cyclase n=1 Tax=Devosia rhizoryzae TaxID=2774137 RepID=A0ABX7C4K6_9HYPH|nr:diguanylate cyclase [Devosia rhizoryzae]QQR38189.1 diguanylate cyclase [Devosia rhizoryzae]